MLLALILAVGGAGLVPVEPAYAADVVRLDVYANPSYGGNATANSEDSTTTAYYYSGDLATIKATAREGYSFIRWRNAKDETVSSSPTYSFTITEDLDLTAEFASPGSEKYSGGSGTAKDPYLISGPEDLLSINQEPDKHYRQTADINMGAYTDMDSIGTGGTLFAGTYDGNGKKIRNLTIHRPNASDSALGESYYVGLFNIGAEGIVKDLSIENASISGTGNAGILAGTNKGQIINCHVEGTVTVTHNVSGAGGLAGENSNLIEGCSAKGSVTGINGMGGLVGSNTNEANHGLIKDSYADVTVRTSNCGGGLVGFNENDTAIETSFANGNVCGGWELGGLVGLNNGSISDCYSTGDVILADEGEMYGGLIGFNGGSVVNGYAIGSVATTADAGGFIGLNNDVHNTIRNCYYDQTTSGMLDTGKGSPKTTLEMLSQSTYEDWDFNGIWRKQSNTYPYLDWQTSRFPVVGTLLEKPSLTLEGTDSEKVNLSWSVVSDATEYSIYQGTQSGVYTQVKTSSANSCTVDGLANGTTYYFAVKALNASGESFYSNEVSGTPQNIVSYQVTITVFDSDNQPISNATVSIGGEQKLTTADGTAVFNLPNKEYAVTLSKLGYVTSISTCTVKGADVSRSYSLSRNNLYAFSFRILDYEDHGIPGAGVRVKDDLKVDVTEYSDGQGLTTFYLKDGSYSIVVTKDGYEEYPTHVTISGGDKTGSIKLVRDTFSGIVLVRAVTGGYVSGAAVTVKNEDMNVNVTALTDSQGRAYFTLKNGFYHLTVEKEGYETIRSGTTIDREDKLVVWDLERKTYPVTLRVRDVEDNLLPGVQIRITGNNPQVDEIVYTGANGEAVVNLPTGEYLATYMKEGYADPDGSGGIFVGAVPAYYIKKLERNKFYVNVYVVDAQNNPLVLAIARVKNNDLGIDESSSTGTDGRAVFFLETGTYDVFASQSGYTSLTNGSITVHPADNENHYFSLSPAAIVSTGSSGRGGNAQGQGGISAVTTRPLSGEGAGDGTASVVEVARGEVSSTLVKRTDNKVSADLSQMDLTKELSSLGGRENRRDNLDFGSDSVLNSESKITLVVPVDEDAREFEVALPDLEKVFEQLDRVSIESDLASFELKKDTFGELGNDDIRLSATKVDRESLPENLQASLPEGVREVIDLNAYVDQEKVSRFNKPIEVSVPYTLKEGEDPEKVSVYLLNDNGSIEKVVGMYDAATGKIKLKRNHFSKYFIAVSDDSFSDIQNSWARQQIEVLAGQGIITGKGNDLFDPDGQITRAEFAVLLARLLDLKADADFPQAFSDVSDQAWYKESVMALYQAGIAAGSPAKGFNPGGKISREETAVLTAKVLVHLGYEEQLASDGRYTDSPAISSWAQGPVEMVFREDVMKGLPEGDFLPKASLSRAQAAQILYRLYQKYLKS